MEWRIIVPVLCLIGILHVRGNAAQSNSNTSTINHNIITGTTNSTANANQTESTNPNATVSQTASSNATATATVSQTASSNATATATASQTASSNTNATTNPSATATIPTPANTASLNLVFKLTQTFKAVFSDLNNPETKQLADEITNAFTPVYRKRFANFRRMFIRKFSAGSVVTDSVLEFDNTNASPNLTEVKNTFVDAITAGGFNFTVDNTSISVSDITTTNATTQATTIVSTTAGFNLSDYNVTFTMNETFSSELSNISSSRAVALAKNITAQFDGVFKKLFTNFVRSLIWRFRNGSIIVDALLGFDKTGSSPTAAEVVKVIVASAKNGTFTFTVNSLSVTDPSGVTANRSPVLASMMTALWMTLASLVVSAVMH
ncbi:uncharacterized protein YBL113C isoform X2 [Sinocyclocheilus grahami]|uniref:uncharacterized protein YBL113C isoform X2 n=1 Tax=Sinocyclocheilus grahami TaxID=75366 RepID=UPI0007ACFB5C|nr:PREDICTED: uncharacterized protein YBL113C-like isoform X2 [Sinocyclocheilus grahami]